MKRLPHLLLPILLASSLLAGIFGIVHAADVVTVWDFSGGAIGPWSGAGYSVEGERLKQVGIGTFTTTLDTGEMLAAMSAVSVTAVNVRFSYSYSTTDLFSSTIQMVSGGPGVKCDNTSLTGSGSLNCTISETNNFLGINLAISGPLSKTVYLDDLTLEVPEENIAPLVPTPTPTKVLFPTPVTSSLPFLPPGLGPGGFPTPFPIPTTSITVSLVPTMFWHIPNWEFTLSVAQTVWTLPYMDELFQFFIFLAGVVIAVGLIRAIIGGRAAAQAQATTIVESRDDVGMFSQESQQRMIAEEAERLRRSEIANRFRGEVRRSFGGRSRGRGRRRRR